jgi:hypothetical protein
MRAQRDAVRLRCAYPLRRFILTPHVEGHHRYRYGTIVVAEGVPATADIRVSTLPLPCEGEHMYGHHKLLLASALPFRNQVDIFWTGVTQTTLSSPEKKVTVPETEESARFKVRPLISQLFTTTQLTTPSLSPPSTTPSPLK